MFFLDNAVARTSLSRAEGIFPNISEEAIRLNDRAVAS